MERVTFLMKTGSIIDNNKKYIRNWKKFLQGHAIAKTDWVSEWLSYYFCRRDEYIAGKNDTEIFWKMVWGNTTEK